MQDDGQIERELALLGDGNATIATTTYQIRVTTGDVSKAGTDADVYIVLYGSKGETAKLTLRESQSFKNKFERGHTDIFNIEVRTPFILLHSYF
jgi:hypothetical protein